MSRSPSGSRRRRRAGRCGARSGRRRSRRSRSAARRFYEREGHPTVPNGRTLHIRHDPHLNTTETDTAPPPPHPRSASSGRRRPRPRPHRSPDRQPAHRHRPRHRHHPHLTSPTASPGARRHPAQAGQSPVPALCRAVPPIVTACGFPKRRPGKPHARTATPRAPLGSAERRPPPQQACQSEQVKRTTAHGTSRPGHYGWYEGFELLRRRPARVTGRRRRPRRG